MPMSKTERIRDILDPVAHQLQNPQELDRVLYQIAREATEYFDAVCCRVWLIRRGDLCATCHWAEQCSDKRRCLHLKASCGAPIDSEFRRAPLDVFSHETIARGGIADWSKRAPEFDFLIDRTWAEQQQLVSFATQPLRVENRVVGLMAIFSRKLIYPADFREMGAFGSYASTAIRVAELTVRAQRAETAMKEKDRELQQTTRLLNSVLNADTEQSVIVEDLEGNVLAFNEGASQAFGYVPEEVIGKINSEKLYAPEDRATGRMMEIFKTTIEQGTYDGTLRRLRKNGEVFVEKATLTLQRDEEGDPAGFLIVARELSKTEIDSAAAPTLESALQPVVVIDPLTESFQALVASQRIDQLPDVVLAQVLRLLPIKQAAFFLLENKKFILRAMLNGDLSAVQAGWKLDSDHARLWYQQLQDDRPFELSAELLPANAPFLAGMAPSAGWWVLPLFQDGPMAVVATLADGGLTEAELETGRQLMFLATRVLDHTLLMEQLNDQLRHLHARYSSLEQEHRLLCDQSTDLQLSRAQLLEQSGNIEANLVRMTGQHRALSQEVSELKGYSSELEQALESFRERQKALQSEINELKPAAERSHGLAKALSEAEATAAQLKENLTEAERHYEQGYRRLSERNAQLEKSMAELQHEQHDRENRLKLLEEQNAVREQHLATLSELETERTAWAVTQERLVREVQEAERKAQEYQENLRRVEASLAQALEQRNEARAGLEAARHEMQSTLEALATDQKRVSALEKELQHKEAEWHQQTDEQAALRKSVSDLEQQVEKFRQQCAELEERYARRNAEFNLQRDELTRLQLLVAPYRELQVKYLDLEQREKLLEERFQGLRSTFEQVEFERTKFEDDLRETRERVLGLQKDVSDERHQHERELEAERQIHQEHVMKLMADIAELEETKRTLNDLSTAYARLRSVWDEAQSDLAQARAAMDTTLNDVRNAEQSTRTLRGEAERLASDRARLLSENQLLHAELDRLKAIPPVDVAPYETRIAELEAVLLVTQARQTEFQQTFEDLEAKMADRSAQEVTLHEQIHQLSERITELSAQSEAHRESTEALQRELEHLQSIPPVDVGPYEERIAYLEQRLSDQETEKLARQDETASLVAESDAHKLEKEQLREAFRDLTRQFEALTAETEAREILLHRIQSELDALRAVSPVDVAPFEARIQELETSLAAQVEHLAESKAEIDRLQKEQADQRAEREHERGELARLHLQANEQFTQISELYSQIEADDAERATLRAAVKTLEERIHELHTRSQRLQMMHDALGSAHDEVKQLLGAAVQDRHYLEREAEQLQAANTRLETQAVQLTALTTQLTTENQELQLQLAELKQQSSQLTSQNEQLQTQVLEIAALYDRQRKQYEVFQARFLQRLKLQEAERADWQRLLDNAAGTELTLHETVRELEQVKTESTQLQARNEQLEAQKGELIIQIDEINTRFLKQKERFNTILPRLLDRLQLMEAERTDWKRLIDHAAAIETDLREALKAREEARHTQEEQVKTELEQELQSLSATLAESRAQSDEMIRTLQARLDQSRVEQEVLHTEIQELHGRLTGELDQTVLLRAQQAQLEAEVVELQTKLEASVDEQAVLQTEVERLQGRLTGELDQAVFLSAENSNLQASVSELQTQLEESEQSRQVLETQVSTTAQALAEAEAARLELSRQFDTQMAEYQRVLDSTQQEVHRIREHLEAVLKEKQTLLEQRPLPTAVLDPIFQSVETLTSMTSEPTETLAEPMKVSVPLRILLASDAPDGAAQLQSLLVEQGHSISFAPDGEAALSAIFLELPDVVIANLESPYFDTGDLLQSMRRNPTWRKLPVILLYCDVPDAQRGLLPAQNEQTRLLFQDGLTEDTIRQALTIAQK
ncbi:MAG: PAS domain S-box protein [Acidobacteria bacterium]|nr:PAS domain S-box protein [Acidobacteriota bacterium]